MTDATDATVTPEASATDPLVSDSPDAADEPTVSKRRWYIWALIVLASLIAIGSGINLWAQKQMLDTDRWVETSNELLADDEVRGALSAFIVDELYRTVDVSAELEDGLPEDFKGLAGPITAALRGPATEGVDRLLSTDAARALWDTANRKAHETIVAVLRDETTVVSTTDGVVTLEMGELVRALGEDLGLPSSLLDAIPEDAGQLVLVESSQLETAQNVVRVIEFLSVLLLLVVVGLYAAAVYAAKKDQRREVLRDVGWAIAISGLIILVLRRVGVNAAVGLLADTPSAEGPVRAVVDIGTELLRLLAWAGLSVGVLIAGYAILIGPTKAATSVRRALAPIFANVALTWVLAALLLYLYGTVSPGFATEAWATAVVFFGLYIAGVAMLRRAVVREFPDASFSGQWDQIRNR